VRDERYCRAGERSCRVRGAAAVLTARSGLQVSSMSQIQPQQLRINLTTNIPIAASRSSNERQLQEAIDVATLSKDAGIGNLTWTHTTEALGTKAVTEEYITVEIREPESDRRTPWEAIVLPIVAGAPLPCWHLIALCSAAGPMRERCRWQWATTE
jgi:hypothetical protein